MGWFLLLSSCIPAARGGQTPTPPIAEPRLSYDFAALMRDDQPVPTGERLSARGEAPAPPFHLAGHEAPQIDRATECLTAAIYYEARSEGEEGQRAVAQVVLNRVRHRDYPSTICGVVYQRAPGRPCQFTFACDGSMRARRESAAWAEARRIAQQALAGSVYEPVGLSTHYHTHAVSPGWGRRLAHVVTVGAHIFYRSPGAAEGRGLARTTAAPEPTPDPIRRRSQAAASVATRARTPTSEPGFVFLADEDVAPAAASVDGR